MNSNPHLQKISTKPGSALIVGYIALLFSPAFFSSNAIFGKLAIDIAPFTLAFIRWSLTALILLIICNRHWSQMRKLALAHWKVLFVLGFLGMFICGGMVYKALQTTSATNGILIYTTPPIIVILIERVFKGRKVTAREFGGIFVALMGVIVIVTKGKIENLSQLIFTTGDLYFIAASISWAIYLVLLKNKAFSTISTLPLLGLISIFGSITLLPMAAFEFFSGQPYPTTSNHWMIIAGIVLFASLIAFSAFQYGVEQIGPSLASIFMYLLPPFGVGFSWGFLGEEIMTFHAWGIATILGGVILATFPEKLLSKGN